MTQLVFVTNSTAAVTETEHDGKIYLIAPVVLINEGVLNGWLYLAEEFGRYVEAWNGRPVSLGHPKRAGQYVSANSPDIWAAEVPGQLWNVYLDQSKLKGEIWIDLEKAEKIGAPALDVVEALRAEEPTEVSTGLFADIEETPGVWTNGESYDGIARNMRPDHLALLPNEIGACSWEDGCGTPRVNQKGERMGDHIKVNELTLDDRASVVRRAFWHSPLSITSDDGWNDWDVISVFETTLIAKDWYKKNHMAFPYTITDSGEVTFSEPVAVEVVYRAKDGGAEVVIANTEGKEQQGLFNRFRRWLAAGKIEGVSAGQPPAVNEQQEVEGMSKCDLVANILANKQNKFSKETLDKWSEADLATLQASLAVNGESQPQAATPATHAAAAQPAALDAKQLAEMVKMAVNEAVAPVLQTIQANADRERAELVAEITANATLTAEQLKALDVEALRALAESVQPRDFGLGAGIFRNSNSSGEDEYELAMPVAWPVNGKAKEDK